MQHRDSPCVKFEHEKLRLRASKSIIQKITYICLYSKHYLNFKYLKANFLQKINMYL